MDIPPPPPPAGDHFGGGPGFSTPPPPPPPPDQWPPPASWQPWQGPWPAEGGGMRAAAPRRSSAALAVFTVLALAAAAAGVGLGFGIHGLISLSARSGNAPLRFPEGDALVPGRILPPSDGAVGQPAPGSTSPPVDSSASGVLDAAVVAASVNPAVVDITSTISGGTAAGTGMVISPSGQVLTNNHVIAGATGIRVQVNGSGPTYTARVVGDDPADDVAVLQMDRASNLKTVSFGDSAKVSVGDGVVAIGNALGRGGPLSVTQGAVTAVNQTITAGDAIGSSETLHGLIQIDAPIQPGDSGGPLVNAAGKVVGVNTAADANGRLRSASRLAFAVPINTARTIAEQIQSGRAGGNVQIGPGAFLGVGIVDPQSQGRLTPGALVIRVQPGSPAQQAGLAVGDVIVGVGGAVVDSASALTPAMRTHHPGDRVSVAWIGQSGQRHEVTVQLAAGPPA
ncbi:MAG: S1C family serine protease [Candidatus Dormibacteria bacterium]